MDGPLGEKLFAGRNGKLIILLVWIYANLLVVPIYTGLDKEVSTYHNLIFLSISQTRRINFKVGWELFFSVTNTALQMRGHAKNLLRTKKKSLVIQKKKLKQSLDCLCRFLFA